jgi:hypothetical protein
VQHKHQLRPQPRAAEIVDLAPLREARRDRRLSQGAETAARAIADWRAGAGSLDDVVRALIAPFNPELDPTRR